MPCAAYDDPRLAAVYDPLNPPGPETPFYLSLAEPAPKAVLDMGCGTGVLACAFAARGHRVTGADPAAGMLAVARARPGGERVTWVRSDAARLSLPERFDHIVMTGHVFQVFLEDAEVRAALASLRRHLKPGGLLSFETRNPGVREWEEWLPHLTRETVEVPGVGPVEVHYDIAAVGGEIVTYETHFRFGPGDVAVAPAKLRFMSKDELLGFLARAGFSEVTLHGDWDRSPVGPASPEIIALAR